MATALTKPRLTWTLTLWMAAAAVGCPFTWVAASDDDEIPVSAPDEAPDPSGDAPDPRDTTKEDEGDDDAIGTDIVQDQPSFLVSVDVDRPDRRYVAGDSLKVTIESEEDVYAYVLYEQADGKTFQIFPNSVQTDNRIEADTPVTIPDSTENFRWQIGAPFGKEKIKILATKEPLEPLEEKSLRAGRFNRVSLSSIRTAAEDLEQSDAVRWGECQVEITTYPSGDQQSVQSGKRFGVFFGVSEYEFDDAAKEMSEQGLNLLSPAPSAVAMETLMRSLGGLNDAQLFVNENVTRQQMETAITGWLPSVSRPGDTIFIFFCGHGSQMADQPQQGDESDGMDEVLTTHDYVDWGILKELLKLQEKGGLDPQLEPRIARWVAMSRQAGSEVQADAALARDTGVSDDLLGHWLQSLAGRRIVVIVDACHSGGVVAGKGVEDEESPFDFLGGEMGRLKDLGQPECAILTACGSQETTLAYRVSDSEIADLHADSKALVEEWIEGPEEDRRLMLLSYYIVENLLSHERPITLSQMHAHCEKGMGEYIDSLIVALGDKNTITPYKPLLDESAASHPIVVKP